MEFIFYETENGKKPVEQFLLALKRKSPSKFKKVVWVIDTIEELSNKHQLIPEHYFKNIGPYLWEIRAKDIRLLCFEDINNDEFILMAHGIIKKQMSLPIKDVDILRSRFKEWQKRRNNS